MEPMEVFDGIMLGDAGLSYPSGGARLDIGLSGRKMGIPDSELLEYLSIIAAQLTALGIVVSPSYPKASNGKCRLLTLTSPFLTKEYNKWYSSRKRPCWKEVPRDLVLTPVSLAHWFMNDGSSSKDRRSRSVNVKLCTQAFGVESIILLEEQLREVGVLHTGRRYYKVGKGAGVEITILQDSVGDFMNTIEPYILDPYRYKIKKPGQNARSNSLAAITL